MMPPLGIALQNGNGPLESRPSGGRRWALLFLAAGLVIACVWLIGAWAEPAPFDPPPPGSFAFAVLGDAPYYLWEEIQYRRVLRQLDANDLVWVLHVGDIFWRPCTDELYRSRLSYFQGLQHPVIYTPGDNEWSDCHEPGSGAFAPRERLARLRQLFFPEPNRSLGKPALPLISQGGDEPFPQFVENARWVHRGIVFATVHLVGSMNGMGPFPGRTEADNAESKQRTEAATAWLRLAFATARQTSAPAVVLAFHADPLLEHPVDDPERQALEPFLTALEEEVEGFPGPVLIAHGGSHEFIADQPLVRRTTGKRLDNLTRLEVPGSPEVGWVRVVVTPGALRPFTFKRQNVPRWLVW